MEIKIGTKGRSTGTVTEENTALAAGSGDLKVFATPFMIALMENAAANSITSFLDEGQSSVGTQISVTHEAATPVGMKVWAESQVIAVDGRKVCFNVEAFDEAGKIGGGTHERFIISSDKFVKRVYEKLK
jgi:predicted thioesterase